MRSNQLKITELSTLSRLPLNPDDIYFYEISGGKNNVTGIVAAVDIDKLIPHENVFFNKVDLYANCIEKSGVMYRPVLISTKAEQSNTVFVERSKIIFSKYNDGFLHKIFMPNAKDLPKIRKFLDCTQKYIISDGHHRHCALQALAKTKDKKYSKIMSFIVGDTSLNLSTFFRKINIDISEILLETIDQFDKEFCLSDINTYREPKCFELLILINGRWKIVSVAFPSIFPHENLKKIFQIEKILCEKSGVNNIQYIGFDEKISKNDVAINCAWNQSMIVLPQLNHVNFNRLVNDNYKFPSHSTFFSPKPSEEIFQFNY